MSGTESWGQGLRRGVHPPEPIKHSLQFWKKMLRKVKEKNCKTFSQNKFSVYLQKFLMNFSLVIHYLEFFPISTVNFAFYPLFSFRISNFPPIFHFKPATMYFLH